MGRIRTTQSSNITSELISKYGIDSFSEDYNKNKEKMKTFPEEFPSKKIMNKVAGSITRAYKKNKEDMQKLLTPSEPVEDEYEEEME